MAEQYQHVHHYQNNDYENTKELFKFIAALIDTDISLKKNPSLLDVGCAKGEFLYYIKKRFNQHNLLLYGVDYSETLIGLARKFKPLDDVRFILDKAEEFRLDRKFDYVVATALISCYEDYEEFLDNMLVHLKDEGKLYVTSGFSMYEYDIILKFRRYDKKTEFEYGWSQHSVKGIQTFLKDRDKQLILHKFEMPFTLEKGDDVIRSWTIDTENGQKFINGLNFIWDVWTMEIY